MPQRNVGQALTAMIAQVFHKTPNDLIVPTASMSHIDPQASPLGDNIYRTDIDHFSYFTRSDIQDFTERFLHE
jgi:hypothetical protein